MILSLLSLFLFVAAALCGLVRGMLMVRLEEAEAQVQEGFAAWARSTERACGHLETVPVESGGETVAHLCLTCDAQLP